MSGTAIDKGRELLSNRRVEALRDDDGSLQSDVAACNRRNSFLHPNLLSTDTPTLPRDAKEVEVELTAYILKSTLGQTHGLEYSRGYIQNWMGDDTVEKVRFGKVFGAVDQILKAGRLEPS